jgi:hypothetical protein
LTPTELDFAVSSDEFLQLGARLRSLAGLQRIALFHLGLALRDHLGDGFAFRIDQQILQILI